MLKKIAFILFVLVNVIANTGCSDKAQLQALTKDSTILAFGDSLTYGTGTSRANAYPAVLQSLTDIKVVNAGIPGETSAEGLTRLPAVLDRIQPDLIVICHGGNDILRKLDMKLAKQNIQQMINLARTKNIQVVLVGVPEFGLFLNTSPIYEELANENNIPIALDTLGDIVGDNSLKSDHIHPNSDGYQLLAEEITVLLQKYGALVNTE